MADINALKNRIRSNVKSNDNQEITGPVMQETLLDMTRELDPSLEEQRAKDAEAALDRGLTYVTTEVGKKPDKVDISQYNSEGAELPLSAYYTYYGNPTHTLAGYYDETDDNFIAVCIYHWEDTPAIVLYVKNDQNKYIWSSFFRSDSATTPLEQHVSRLFAGSLVTADKDGLMRATDKVVFDEMVTEVFPLTVAIASSNAGTREIGTSITPVIVLDITRKGADVAASASVSVSPNDGSLSQDKKTYTGASISSGSKTYQIVVAQGGQTFNVPIQKFEFMNYLYRGVLDTKPTNANNVKSIIEGSWRISNRTLSTAKTLGETSLAANKYYLFAAKETSGAINLVVKNAKSGGTISVPNSDKGSGLSIARLNGTGYDDYSWIIVPASSSAWYFMITNS